MIGAVQSEDAYVIDCQAVVLRILQETNRGNFMSKFAAKAYHPINGAPEDTWEGFSWPCMFLGFIWYIYKGMWGWALIALILAMLTFGVSWLFFPFHANDQYTNSLLKRGYLNKSQWEAMNKSASTVHTSSNQRTSSSTADELAKLVALKSQGILTESEFATQKAKLLT